MIFYSLNFLTIIVSVFSLSRQPKEASCPLATDIVPCICTSTESFELDLDCSDVKTDAELENVFQQVFPFSEFRKFTLIHSISRNDELSNLTSTTFGHVSFQEVRIQGTTLTNIGAGTFSGSNATLTSILIIKNAIQSFPFEDLSQMTVLETLNLQGNDLSEIPVINSRSLKYLNFAHNLALQLDGDEFTNCTQIYSIDLDDANLLSIPTGLFRDLTNVKEIKFIGNKISNLKAGDVSPAAATLELLYLGRNGMSSMEPGAITGMSPLGFIDFSNNKIIDLPQNAFQPVFDQLFLLKTIDLSNNPLRCGCDMAWLVLNAEYVARLTDLTTCKDGTFVKDLPTEPFYQC